MHPGGHMTPVTSRSAFVSTLTRGLPLLGLLSALVPGCVQDTTESSSHALLSSTPVQLHAAATDTHWESGWGYFAHAEFTVRVENLAYDKSVEVHYKTGDAPWMDLELGYHETLATGSELWIGGVSVLSYASVDSSADTQFAVKYTVDGTTHWDSNNGADYWLSAGVKPGAGSHPPFVLGSSRHIKTEYASLDPRDSGLVLSGEVVVRNIAYDKHVTLVYTTDDWATVHTAPFGYDSTLSGGDESWTIDATVWDPEGPDTEPGTIEFAIAYDVAGVTYWDNNDSVNYSLDVGDEYRAGSDALYPR